MVIIFINGDKSTADELLPVNGEAVHCMGIDKWMAADWLPSVCRGNFLLFIYESEMEEEEEEVVESVTKGHSEVVEEVVATTRLARTNYVKLSFKRPH